MTANPPDERSMRADARRNRGLIVDAAQKAFAQRGLDVPLEAVAEDAGVGIGTLYRRFPTRDDLIAACFERRVEEYARAAEEALEAADAWEGFKTYVERICGMQAVDRGLKDVLTRTFPTARALEAHRTRGYEASVRVMERAQAAGLLRSDAVPEDLVLLLMANAGVVQGGGDAAPGASRRFIALALDGLRSGHASELPPAPTPRQVMRAMRRLSRPKSRSREVKQ